jgi:multidrug efflux pump subunit AcrA (membrane-fusion protein)
MDPMKIITYVAITAVVAFVALGGLGFYVGSSLSDRFSAAGNTSAGSGAAIEEIKGLNQQIAELKETLAERRDNNEQRADALAESQARLAKMADELDAAKQELADAREEIASLTEKLAAATQGQSATALPAAAQGSEQRTAAASPAPGGGAVVLYDRFQLEREAARGFDQVDLRFGLETVGSRSAGLSVNGKRISMQVQDGKQIIHKGVTCELILLDTDQTVQRAQFSLACTQ